MKRRDVLRGMGALSASMLSGCGGGAGSISGPSGGPTSSAGKMVRMSFGSQRHQTPIAGATAVLADGTRTLTDAAGEVTAPSGSIVEVTATGMFGPRRVRAEEGLRDWLLPDDAQMPAWWIKQALYSANDFSWLWRPLPGAFLVVPTSEVYADSFAMDAIREGIDIINSVHRHLSFVLGAPGQQGSRVVDIKLNPAVSAYAVTLTKASGATTVGALIEFSVFRLSGFSRTMQERHATRAVAHELAHVAGLSGHPSPISGVYSNGMMWGSEPVLEFVQPEADILNWLFLREPGTRPPDDSSATPIVASADSTSTWRKVCELER
jgi:hypothetical protein